MKNYATACYEVTMHLDVDSDIHLVYEWIYKACELADASMHSKYLKTRNKVKFDSRLLLWKMVDVILERMDNSYPEDVASLEDVAFVLEYIATYPPIDVTASIRRWLFGHADESSHDLNRLDT